MKFLANLDLNLNQLIQAVFHLLGTDPQTPTKGQVWFNSTSNTLKIYDGTSVKTIVNGVGVSAPITKSGTDASPVIGISDATSSTSGAMPFSDKAKLDNSTASSTPSTLVIRDSAGNSSFADPTTGSHAATKNYVDNLSFGLKWKDPVKAATTLEITLSGIQTIDGIPILAGDRVLVKNQSTSTTNGIYIAASGPWSRSEDFNSDSEVASGTLMVSRGTVNADTQWTCTTDSPVLGTSAIVFVQMNGGSSITAGDGLAYSGNTLNVGTASTSRIVVNADNIDLATTGVSQGTYSKVTVDSYGRVTAGNYGASYAVNVGDASGTQFVVTHNLNTRDINVQVYRNSSPWDTVFCDVERNGVNEITLRFAIPPTSNEYRVVIS